MVIQGSDTIEGRGVVERISLQQPCTEDVMLARLTCLSCFCKSHAITLFYVISINLHVFHKALQARSMPICFVKHGADHCIVFVQLKETVRQQAAYDVDPPLGETASYIKNNMSKEGYRHLLAVGKCSSCLFVTFYGLCIIRATLALCTSGSTADCCSIGALSQHQCCTLTCL